MVRSNLATIVIDLTSTRVATLGGSARANTMIDPRMRLRAAVASVALTILAMTAQSCGGNASDQRRNTAAQENTVTSAATPTPPHLSAALADMQETGRAGIVLLVPDDPAAQARLGSALYALTESIRGRVPLFDDALSRYTPKKYLEHDTKTIRADPSRWTYQTEILHALSVLVALRTGDARTQFKATDEDAILVLHADGTLASRHRTGLIADDEANLARLLDLVRGQDLRTIRGIAKAAMARLTSDQRARFEEDYRAIQSGDLTWAGRVVATERLRRMTPLVLPQIVLDLETARTKPCKALLRRLHLNLRTPWPKRKYTMLEIALPSEVPPLPYGTRMPDPDDEDAAPAYSRRLRFVELR
ncbi:MAG: hypothetical protein H6832_16240 [Planctomycetes bacterium]|nr:hypothetical protein [Planctomycetota bacterium]